MIVLLSYAMMRYGVRSWRPCVIVMLVSGLLGSTAQAQSFPSGIRQVAATGAETVPAAAQASWSVPGECPPICYDCSPRIGPAYGLPCPVIPCGPGVVCFDPTHYPDEYLCDGGDRAQSYWNNGQHSGGLDTEDTIAEYVDVTGKRRSVPSSKVCVYAPRFAALRTITGTVADRNVYQAAGAHHGIRTAGYANHLRTEQEVQRDHASHLRDQSRASNMEANAADGGLAKVDAALTHHNWKAAYQNLAFLRDGLYRQADAAILAYAAQNAGVWTRDLNPMIYAHDTRGHEVVAKFSVAEYVGLEDRRMPGLLRIVKLADVETAHPGDVITFTLRFDNLGDLELRDIRISDNLTPRLEYIAGSVQAELAGGLDIEPNGEGSSILTFILDQPLAGKSGGTISFQCRVK
jgi:uncharacterized repeat protein (TIGR01451 family)